MTRFEILLIRAAIALALVGAALLHARADDGASTAFTSDAPETAGTTPRSSLESIATR